MATPRTPRPPEGPQPVVLSSRRASLVDRLFAEGVVSVVAAAAAEGVAIGPKQALRWTQHGVGGVVLESVRVGGRRMTSRAAFRRFVAAQQREVVPGAATLNARAADAVLAAHGLSRSVEGAQ